MFLLLFVVQLICFKTVNLKIRTSAFPLTLVTKTIEESEGVQETPPTADTPETGEEAEVADSDGERLSQMWSVNNTLMMNLTPDYRP